MMPSQKEFEGIRRLVISRHLKGMSNKSIATALGKSQAFISNVICRWRKMGTTQKKASPGRPRSVRTKELIKKVRDRVRRNAGLKARKLAAELHISRMSAHRVLNNDLGLKAYRRQKRQLLTDRNKAVRVERCKHLLKKLAAARGSGILFSDEKKFTVAQSVNKQNDRVYARDIKEANDKGRIVGRRQTEQSVMVWLGVCEDGKTDLVFIPEGVKINANVYVRDILEKQVKPFGQSHFKNKHWIYQQDGAPAHTSRLSQEWCRHNCPDFISSAEWPPYSPDLNPLDFAVWGKMEAEVSASRHTNLASLKRTLLKPHANLSNAFLCAACSSFKSRLRQGIRAKGSYIE